MILASHLRSSESCQNHSHLVPHWSATLCDISDTVGIISPSQIYGFLRLQEIMFLFLTIKQMNLNVLPVLFHVVTHSTEVNWIPNIDQALNLFKNLINKMIWICVGMKDWLKPLLFVAQVWTILKIKSLITEHNVGKKPPLIYRNWENKEETHISKSSLIRLCYNLRSCHYLAKRGRNKIKMLLIHNGVNV